MVTKFIVFLSSKDQLMHHRWYLLEIGLIKQRDSQKKVCGVVGGGGGSMCSFTQHKSICQELKKILLLFFPRHQLIYF